MQKFNIKFGESRLLFLDRSRREDVLEDVEANGVNNVDLNPLDDLKNESAKLLDEVNNIRNSFLKRLFLGGDKRLTEIKTNRIMKEEAERRLDDEIKKISVNTKHRLGRAERKARIQEIQKTILLDLQKYLQTDIERLQAKQSAYGKWAKFLTSGDDPISLQELQESESMLNIIYSATERADRKKQREVVDKSEYLNTESMLRTQLDELNIIEPDEFDNMLDLHFRGDSILVSSINTSQVLRRRKSLKKALIRAAESIRSENAKGYRLDKLSEADPNIGTVEERITHIREKGYPGYPITFSLSGVEVKTRILNIKGGVIILRDRWSQKYLVMDLESKAITYRNNNGKISDTDLNETKLILAA
jgi:hypothetical protein